MKLQSLLSSILQVTLLATGAFGYADPGACSGQCWSHDPSLVLRDDGVYFRFETGSLIGIWKSSDLSGPWEYQGAAVPDGSIIDLPGNDDLWVRFIFERLLFAFE